MGRIYNEKIIKIIITFVILCIETIPGRPVIQADISQPGVMILEVVVDSIMYNAVSGQIEIEPAGTMKAVGGYPVLPVFSEILVNIPPDASIEVFTDEEHSISDFTPSLAPQEQAKGAEFNISGNSWDGSRYPGIIAELVSAGSFRGNPSSLINIYPLQVTENRLFWHKNISVKITWNDSGLNRPVLFSEVKLDEIQRVVQPSSLYRTTLLPGFHYFQNILKLTIDSTGWYQVSHSELADSSVEMSGLDPRTFRLWNMDQEVLLLAEGESDGVFDSEDRLIFYGEKNPPPPGASYRNNFYSDDNVYWLTWGGTERGARYVSESVYPGLPENQVSRPISYRYTELIEEDSYFARLGNMHTHRQWDEFDHFFMEPPVNGGTSVDYEFELADPRNTNTSEFNVTLELQGITTNEHTLQAFINDYKVAEAAWTGQNSHRVTENSSQVLPNNFLVDGTNSLLLTLAGNDPTNRYDQVYLNWIEITYDRLYMADDGQIEFSRNSDLPITTQYELGGFSDNLIYLFKDGISRLQDFVILQDHSNGMYKLVFQDNTGNEKVNYTALTASKLKQVKSLEIVDPAEEILSSGGSDYLVICPDSFKTVLEPLISLHNGTAVDIEEVYRQYSGGVLSPYAIRDFLTDVYHYWSPVPSAVLIAMQGGFFGWVGGYSHPDEYIPAMRMQTVKWGAASSDFWFTLVDGNDYIPEFSIGRLPAKDVAELELMVEKIVSFQAGERESWQNQVLMIAGYEQAFKIQSEAMVENIVDRGLFPIRLNIDKYSEGGPFFGTTDTLLSHFARGLAYVNFLGHGGGAVWGDRSLFTLADVDYLSNPGRTPFVTSMTCFTGDVTNPNALGRRLMGHEDGGVSGWFGSAGVGWIINDYLLLQPIHKYLFDSPGHSIGELISRGKIEYIASNTSYPDIARTQIFQFNLSGDPAMVLSAPDISELEVVPADPEPGETVQILSGTASLDSLQIQLFDGERIPTTRRPFLLEPGSDQNYYLTIPDSLQQGNYSLVASFRDNGSLFRSSIPITIAGAYAKITEIQPANPTILDSIQVMAEIHDRQGISGVQLYLNGGFHANMVHHEGDFYRLSNPIPPRGYNTVLSLRCRVTDNIGQVTMGPEKKVAVRSLPDFSAGQISIQAKDDILLVTPITNNSTGSGSAYVKFEMSGSTGWLELGSDTLVFTGRGTTDAAISTALPSGSNAYRVSLSSDYENVDMDTVYQEVETTAFWVTPELGTTHNLMNHATVDFRNLSIEVPPASVISRTPIVFSASENVDSDGQPALENVIADSNCIALSVDVNQQVQAECSWIVGAGLNPGDILYSYYKKHQVWLPVENYLMTDSIVVFSADFPTKLAWFNSSDVTGPDLEATINGQRFLRNSYVNKSPLISLLVRDDNGIDHRQSAIQAWINSEKIDEPNLQVMGGNSRQVGLQFTPSLSTSDSSLAILARDASGNLSDTLSLKFIVSGKLTLIDYGNFPNPFTDQTRFSYELTETVDEFSLDIYTVDGRRIRSLRTGSTLTDIDPRIGAYHEIIWDGRDNNGEFVANGVYFYQIKVKKGKTVLDRRGKIAKAR